MAKPKIPMQSWGNLMSLSWSFMLGSNALGLPHPFLLKPTWQLLSSSSWQLLGLSKRNEVHQPSLQMFLGVVEAGGGEKSTGKQRLNSVSKPDAIQRFCFMIFSHGKKGNWMKNQSSRVAAEPILGIHIRSSELTSWQASAFFHQTLPSGLDSFEAIRVLLDMGRQSKMI